LARSTSTRTAGPDWTSKDIGTASAGRLAGTRTRKPARAEASAASAAVSVGPCSRRMTGSLTAWANTSSIPASCSRRVGSTGITANLRTRKMPRNSAAAWRMGAILRSSARTATMATPIIAGRQRTAHDGRRAARPAGRACCQKRASARSARGSGPVGASSVCSRPATCAPCWRRCSSVAWHFTQAPRCDATAARSSAGKASSR